MSTLVALEDKTLEEDVDTSTLEGTGQTFQDVTRMTGGGDLEVAAHPDIGEGDRGATVLPDPTIARDRGATVHPDLTIVVTEALLLGMIGRNVRTIIKMRRNFHQTDTEGMEAIEIMDTDPGEAEILGILTEDPHIMIREILGTETTEGMRTIEETTETAPASGQPLRLLHVRPTKIELK